MNELNKQKVLKPVNEVNTADKVTRTLNELSKAISIKEME